MSDSKAKMGVLKELRKMAMEDMGTPLKNSMKKVTVAAPDEKGLEKGLAKAKDLVDDMPEEDEDLGEMPELEEESEGSDDVLKMLVDSCGSAEELDEKIVQLQKLKAEKYGEQESEEMDEEQPNPFEGMDD